MSQRFAETGTLAHAQIRLLSLETLNETLNQPNPSEGFVRRFFSKLGPGLITGAADDDPSGIATYSVTGAAFGYGPLWTALFSFPLWSAVQLMCARLGMVTGRGLAAVIRRRYPRWVLWCACAVLIVANVINIGADLGGMGAATQMVTGISAFCGRPLYAVVIVAAALRHQLSHDGARFQVAHAGVVRLCHHGVHRAAGLGPGAARHA